MFNKETFFGDVLKVISGNVLATIVAIIAAPVLTRLFVPSVFGVSTLFFSITSVFGVVTCLRYEPAIVLAEDDGVSANVFAICLVIMSLFAIGISFMVIFWGQAISEFFRAPTLSRYLWLLPLAVFLLGISNAVGSWNTKMKNFGYFPIIHTLNECVSVSTQIGAGLSGYITAGGLIVGNLFGNICAWGAFLALTVREYGHSLVKLVSIQGIREAFIRYLRFPLVDTWSALLNNISLQIPVFMLSIYFSSRVVGLFGLVYLVLMTPSTIIASAISLVFFQRASRQVARGGQLRSNAEQLFRTFVTLGLFPTLVLMITGPDLFSVVFGPLWREGGIYAQILCGYCFLNFLTLPLLQIYYAHENLGFALKFNIANVSSRFLGLYIGGVLLNEMLALFLMSAAGIMIYSYTAWRIMRLEGVEGPFIRDVGLRNTARFIPAGIFLIIAEFLGFSSVIIFGIVCIVFLAYYGYILKTDKYFQDLVKSIINQGPVSFNR